jgi:hypothetical protein
VAVTVLNSVLPGSVITLAVFNRNHKLKKSKYLMNVNKYSVDGIATRHRLEGPGIESRWGERASLRPRMALVAHLASYTMGTGSFLGVKWPRRSVDQAPHLAPGLKEYRYTSTPLLGFRGLFKGELHFYIYVFILNKFPYIRLNAKLAELRKSFFHLKD